MLLVGERQENTMCITLFFFLRNSMGVLCVFTCVHMKRECCFDICHVLNSERCMFHHRINTPRKQGGLGPIKIPLLSDLTHQISKDYGVYLEDSGHTLR